MNKDQFTTAEAAKLSGKSLAFAEKNGLLQKVNNDTHPETQKTPEQLDAMSPAEVLQAAKDGTLDAIRQGQQPGPGQETGPSRVQFDTGRSNGRSTLAHVEHAVAGMTQEEAIRTIKSLKLPAAETAALIAKTY